MALRAILSPKIALLKPLFKPMTVLKEIIKAE
jgi:hypothetical protein